MPGAPQPKCALNYSPNSVRLPLPQGAAAGGGHLDRWMRSMDGKRPIKAAKAFTANDTPTPFGGTPATRGGTPGRDTSANGLPAHGPARPPELTRRPGRGQGKEGAPQMHRALPYQYIFSNTFINYIVIQYHYTYYYIYINVSLYI